MDLGIRGKVALVVGASTGIGRAIATELVEQAACVAIASRSRERIDRAATVIGARGFVHDTADLEAAPQLVEQVAESFGKPVEILVTNTGGPPPGIDPLAFAVEQWREAYDALVLAPMALIDAVVPGMCEGHFGRIVNVATLGVREPIAPLLLSTAHRSATLNAFKVLSSHLASDGITVNSVLPGRIATDRAVQMAGSQQAAEEQARATVPAGRLGRPEEVAAATAFLCSTRAAYITGTALIIDGGLARSV